MRNEPAAPRYCIARRPVLRVGSIDGKAPLRADGRFRKARPQTSGGKPRRANGPHRDQYALAK